MNVTAAELSQTVFFGILKSHQVTVVAIGGKIGIIEHLNTVQNVGIGRKIHVLYISAVAERMGV